MKKYRDFIPRSDGDLMLYAVVYKQNFPKLAGEAISFLSQHEVAAHEKEVQDMIDAIQDVDTKKAELAAAIALKNTLVQTTTGNIRRMAMLAKKGSARDTAIVQSGALKCNTIQVDIKNLSPQLNIITEPDKVIISFPKNYSLPIALYSRRSDYADWEFVSYAATSPYIDKRPPIAPGQPEKRYYQAYYTNFKESISQLSNVVEVVFNPMKVAAE